MSQYFQNATDFDARYHNRTPIRRVVVRASRRREWEWRLSNENADLMRRLQDSQQIVARQNYEQDELEAEIAGLRAFDEAFDQNLKDENIAQRQELDILRDETAMQRQELQKLRGNTAQRQEIQELRAETAMQSQELQKYKADASKQEHIRKELRNENKNKKRTIERLIQERDETRDDRRYELQSRNSYRPR
ncbi:hypothetical protein FHETE_10911 [Fusarium heterosporum]|uniref:Uncharacterized protein n=1 Tax=Fusarium heterosporum TaxID=42747 RepID=A0A8H5SN16_FUSHE|nr:hypothetical protein FHETE_10911 [Fusarium heterosporum]